jgi:hypothetical protein
MVETRLFTTNDDFLFKTPLYAHLPATDDQLYELRMKDLLVDGYCPHCRQVRTFSYKRKSYNFAWWNAFDPKTESTDEIVDLVCTRYDDHTIRLLTRISDSGVQKIGQFPSFADIAIDESKAYSKLLSKEDAAEFHKAIGLAAHNVGIGSYVYFRRIFERLIAKRFSEYKVKEGWQETEFKALRMKEKIELLKNHLPEFLVKNAKLYSILSLGIHELNEKDCLAFFPVLRQSTIWILEQDKKKQEDLAQQKELEQAISSFSPKPGKAESL